MCKDEAGWLWQPFGPGENAKTFVTPGSQYRGFPALPVCDSCQDKVAAGEKVEFRYKSNLYKCAEGYVYHSQIVEIGGTTW
jgi:hypothetical protein